MDKKSVAIENPKFFTKLSKPIKQPDIITQKPKWKIKDYVESKATDYKQKK